MRVCAFCWQCLGARGKVLLGLSPHTPPLSAVAHLSDDSHGRLLAFLPCIFPCQESSRELNANPHRSLCVNECRVRAHCVSSLAAGILVSACHRACCPPACLTSWLLRQLSILHSSLSICITHYPLHGISGHTSLPLPPCLRGCSKYSLTRIVTIGLALSLPA